MIVASHLSQEQFVCHQPAQLGELGFDPIQSVKDYVDQKYSAVVADIRAKVKDEVLAQIPTIRSAVTSEVMSNVPEIRSQVRKEAQSAVKPWIIGTLVVGGLGLAFGVGALIKLKRRKKR